MIIEIQQLLYKWHEVQPMAAAKQDLLMQRLRMEWNYHSNKIEGNTLSYGETKALLMFGITAGAKPLRHHIEMSGHNEALMYLMDVVKEGRPLTENFIRQVHSLVLKEAYYVDAVTDDGAKTRKKVEVGQYKTQPNHVRTRSGEIFRFASPEETPAMMKDLVEWYRRSSDVEGAEVIRLAAEFHYKFIRIHPFDDGNGRTVRILMNFILMGKGYPPIIIRADDKSDYLLALQGADAGNFMAFLDFITLRVKRSLETIFDILDGKNKEDLLEGVSRDFIQQNLYLKESQPSYALDNVKAIKKRLGITDNHIAEWLMYKNDKAYRQSSAKKRVEHFIVKFYEQVIAKEVVG